MARFGLDELFDDFVITCKPKLPLQSVKEAAGVFTNLNCGRHEL